MVLLPMNQTAVHKFVSEEIPGTMSESERLKKLMEEIEEFKENPGREEAADVYITLLAWAEMAGIQVEYEVRKKFEELRDAVWYEAEPGFWRRVKDPNKHKAKSND